MDTSEEVRFRVVDETFVDTTPVGPEDVIQPGAETGNEQAKSKKSPYSLTVCTLTNYSGLCLPPNFALTITVLCVLCKCQSCIGKEWLVTPNAHKLKFLAYL